MSANAKPAAPKTVTEETAVPAQNSGEKKIAAVVQEAVAADTMIDALKKIEDRLAEGVTVTIKVHENGSIDLDVVEDGKVKSLAGKAKGVFQRNKKLVLATAGLAATSLLLKVIANRQAALEADEVVETSDDVAVDA